MQASDCIKHSPTHLPAVQTLYLWGATNQKRVQADELRGRTEPQYIKNLISVNYALLEFKNKNMELEYMITSSL